MIGSVPIVDGSAYPAPFGGAGRIDERNGNAGQPRFVRDKAAKLAERPIVKLCPVPASGLNPVSDVRQVLKTYRTPGALRGGNERLRNAMVRVGLKSPLFAGEFAEAALGGPRAPALKASFPARKLDADALDPGSRIGPPVAVEGQIDDAKIDAKHIGDADLFRVRHVADAGEIPLAAHVHQIDFALSVGQQGALAFTANEGDLHPARQRPDRDKIAAAKADNAIIVGLSCETPKRALHFLVDLVAIGHLGDAAHCGLRRQIEHRPRIAVGHLVQIELPEFSICESLGREKIASLIAALKRLAQRAGLRLVRLQLDVRNQLHILKYGDVFKMFNRQKKGREFLSGLKAGVSLAQDR